jgi:hypothetical protein
MDLFRAIFRNTDSEDSSSSDEDETKKDSSIHDDEDTKDNSEKMETGPADDRLSTQGDRLPTGNIFDSVEMNDLLCLWFCFFNKVNYEDIT